MGQGFYAEDYVRLSELLTDVSFEDVTPLLEELETVKDLSEQESLRHGAAIADEGYRRVWEVLRSGVSEWTLNGAVNHELFARGAFDTIPLTLHRRGEPYLAVPQDRSYDRGELVSYSVEIPSPDGYWVELARMFSLGPPDDPVRRQVDCLHAVHLELIDHLRPGTRVGDLAELADKIARDAGYSVGIWLGHGIGLNLPDWPPIVPSENTEVRDGMAFAVHPHLIDEAGEIGVYVADTIIVESGRAVTLSELPLELVVLE
jgi:Xaa-Pro dipeptidase